MCGAVCLGGEIVCVVLCVWVGESVCAVCVGGERSGARHLSHTRGELDSYLTNCCHVMIHTPNYYPVGRSIHPHLCHGRPLQRPVGILDNLDRGHLDPALGSGALRRGGGGGEE